MPWRRGASIRYEAWSPDQVEAALKAVTAK
jgi:hypothetical protein